MEQLSRDHQDRTDSHEDTPGGDAPPWVDPAGQLGWRRLGRFDRLAVVLVMAVLAVATVPRLRPGVCFSDAGDLQLASATLGIMHPPGYAGYATIGYVLTRIPWVDPAYVVSVACLAAGIVALVLCVMIQVRLGGSPWLAGAITLALPIHSRVWTNLVVPEVYMPTLALLLGSVYLMVRYERLDRRRDLYVAALLFGVALANRPTVVWMLPFFLVAWVLVERLREPAKRRWGRTVLWITCCGIGPGLYSLGYVWVRDTPATPYNYIDHKNAEIRLLPESDAGWRAKCERIAWHASGREFGRYMNTSWKRAWRRVQWLYKQFFLLDTVDVSERLTLLIGPHMFPPVVVVLLLGFALTYARCRVSFVLLLGLVIGNLVFICTYNIYGTAADLLPLMFTAVILAGVALSTLFPLGAAVRRTSVAVVMVLIMSVVSVVHTPYMRKRDTADATWFIQAVDLPTLPEGAVICSTWRQSTALWYAKHILTPRPDIDVINTTTHQWKDRIEAVPDRPVFAVVNSTELADYVVTPYRVMPKQGGDVTVLWRVERPAGD
jgi:hypothetical protein